MVKNPEKFKVLVAMSGGVDSSVAAALLVKAGFAVTGAFMVNFQASLDELRPASCADSLTGRSATETCWRGDYQDALRVAAKLGIPLLRLNFTKEYKKMVLDYMYREYKAGRTPNPDVLCNKFVKFGAWLKKAKKLGFDYLATGHYARLGRKLKTQNSKLKTLRLMSAVDDNKDQTYFLHQLSQAQLKHVLFPIGEYTKPQVRALAKKLNLPTADKEESMGICFIGEVPMKKFLMKKIKLKPGKIIFSPSCLSAFGGRGRTRGGEKGDEVVGEHDGLAFYTIGERVGIPCHSERVKRPKNPLAPTQEILRCAQDDNDTKPFYVVGKNIRKNELIVGYENDPLLFTREIKVKDINWIAGRTPKFPLKCEVRLRHRQSLQRAVARLQTTDYRLRDARSFRSVDRRLSTVVRFNKPQRAATPGQFAVFYLRGECLGGGVIS